MRTVSIFFETGLILINNYSYVEHLGDFLQVTYQKVYL